LWKTKNTNYAKFIIKSRLFYPFQPTLKTRQKKKSGGSVIRPHKYNEFKKKTMTVKTTDKIFKPHRCAPLLILFPNKNKKFTVILRPKAKPVTVAVTPKAWYY
jgi:hypothetical protein